MKLRQKAIDELLNVTSRRELQSQSKNWHWAISLPNALSMTRHLTAQEPAEYDFRLGVIHTYTSDLLDPWLDFHSRIQGLQLYTYHAPYGMNLMESQQESGLIRHQPDMTLFLLTRDDLHPEFALPFTGFDPQRQLEVGKEAVDRLMGILTRFRSAIPGRMVVTILPRLMPPSLGLYDAQAEQSEEANWAKIKITLASAIGKSLESAMFLDLDQILAEIGRSQFFDLRFWYSSRFPFTPLGANELCNRVLSLASASKYPKTKVIVLDADNTLWGGIIGEDGINGIGLGPEYPGNAFVDFQRRLLGFQKRGFILALCSKNNPQDLQEVLEKHPHQVLKSRHFSAQRVNWLPKHENLISLAEELNLGLDSFVFVDDSDHECAMVRLKLPQVQVIQTPKQPIDVPFCLEHIARLEILSLTQEDLKKTDMYAQETERRMLQKDIRQEGGGLREYLASLDMKMSISIDSKEHLQRLTQLTQKTNQFNLTTHRYNEQQMLQYIESTDWTVASFSLCDIFGDSGIVGLALIKHLDRFSIEIDTLLMSCRVIGRGAETVFLESILMHLASNAITQVVADYLPTRKNGLVSEFYKEHGFSPGEDGRFYRDLEQIPIRSETWPPIETDISLK